jgi:hypothetical protein
MEVGRQSFLPAGGRTYWRAWRWATNKAAAIEMGLCRKKRGTEKSNIDAALTIDVPPNAPGLPAHATA